MLVRLVRGWSNIFSYIKTTLNYFRYFKSDRMEGKKTMWHALEYGNYTIFLLGRLRGRTRFGNQGTQGEILLNGV
jgi:hypothetical protein